MALSVRTLKKLGVDERTARAHQPYLTAAMRECDITTKARSEMFLAQLFHESIMLSTFEEIASGAKYEGRKDLGNVQRGDGVRFKGRGPIQVTGRANYKWMSEKLGVDFIKDPKLLATARYGYRAAAYFWQRQALNAKADKGDFEGVTRSINGAATWGAPSHQGARVALLNRVRKVDVRPGRAFLRRGDEGDAVLALTRRLSYLDSPASGTRYLDGKRRRLDGATVKALKGFQTDHGLKVDGRFGPESAEALTKAVARKKAAAPGTPADAKVPGVTKRHEPTKRREPVERQKPTRRSEHRVRPRPRTSTELLGELDRIDQREDRIFDALLQRGERLERRARQSEQRRRVVTAGDLATVKEGLVALDQAMTDLQARIERAETAPGDAGAASAALEGTFAELGARIHQHDATAELLRSRLRERLGALEPAATTSGTDGVTSAKAATRRSRTFKITRTPMQGADVKSFQRLLNQRYDAWKIERRIAESGTYTAETRDAAHQIVLALGLTPKAYEHGITPELRSLIRKPSRRTPRQLERAKARRAYRRKLQERYGPKPQAAVATTSSVNGAFMGTQSVALSLAAIGHDLGLQTTSEKRNNTNPHSGKNSDHDHRNTDAYAYDISDGSAPTPGMDRAAFRIMHELGFKSYKLRQPIDTTQGRTTINRGGHRFRVQVIYRGSGPAFGGNHLNHIHIGVKRVG